MPREGSLVVAYHFLKDDCAGLTYDSLMARVDMLDDFTDTLAFGAAAPGDHLDVHAENAFFHKHREEVVSEVRVKTARIGELNFGGPQEYNDRTSNVALAYLDTVLHRDPIPREEFYRVLLACVLIAVKIEETTMPPLVNICAAFGHDPELVRVTEIRVLKTLNHKTHVLTVWDYLLCWLEVVRELRELPDAEGLVHLGILATPSVEGEHGFGTLAITYLEELSSRTTLLPTPETLELLRHHVPFSRSAVLDASNLAEYAPHTFDYCVVNPHKFKHYPPSILALCCMLVGAQRSLLARSPQPLYVSLEHMTALAEADLSHDPHMAAYIPGCFATIMLSFNGLCRSEAEVEVEVEVDAAGEAEGVDAPADSAPQA